VIEYFGCHEDFEVFVNLDRVSRTFKIMTPVLHTIDKGEYFSVMDIIIIFSWNVLSGPEGDR
jgi:hypothetical protein